MYIFIGADCLIKEDEIVGIFDLETTTTSYITRDYLAAAQKKGRVINVSYDIPKTFIVCRRDGEIFVYLSQYSSATINKRRILNSINNSK